MTINPVEHIPVPGYPDKYDETSRQALAAARPRRWITAPVAAGLAATVAIGFSGCGTFAAEGLPAQTTETPTQTTAETAASSAATTDYILLGDPVPVPVPADAYIPLFEYGEGTGSIGCVSIAAPVFLSEEEAFAIVSAAFAEVGVMLRRNSATRPATLPVTVVDTWDDHAPKTKPGKLMPDALADELPVEFVSREDVKAWEYKPAGKIQTWSSVSSYAMKGAAQTLAENNPGLVVFYDPVSYWDMAGNGGSNGDFGYAPTEGEARAESQRLLRQQVQAFVAWLEGAR